MLVHTYFDAADAESDNRFGLSDQVYYVGHWCIITIRDAKFSSGGPAEPAIQAQPGFLRSPD